MVNTGAISSRTANSVVQPECDDLCERAFQLAYFILQDRSSAIDAVHRAKKRLVAEQSREKKRIYWRSKRLKQKIRRMSRDEQDALQWLIYSESERYERWQEQNEIVPERIMVVRYIKFILQITSNMSCFYVAVGLHRILHNYTTPEVQQAYEFLTQDYAGAEKYRRVKKKLVQKLLLRFCEFITLSQLDNQELRFDVCESQQEWVDVAALCLEKFTPWSTWNICQPAKRTGPVLVGESAERCKRRSSLDPEKRSSLDLEEMRRCHAFVHPPCFEQLACELQLDPWPTRLSIPRFKMKNDQNLTNKPQWTMRKARPLSTEERASLEQSPEPFPGDSNALPKVLTIVADDVPCAQMDLIRETQKEWRIEEGVRLIEIFADTSEPRTAQAMALHWIEYTDVDGIAGGEYTIPWKGLKELRLRITPFSRDSDQAGDAIMQLQIISSSWFARWMESIQSLFRFMQAPAYAMAGLLFLFGCLWFLRYNHGEMEEQQSDIVGLSKDRALQENARVASPQEHSSSSTTSNAPAAYRLLPDSLSVRGAGKSEPTVVVDLKNNMPVVQFELSIDGASTTSYRAALKLFSNQKEILRQNSLKPMHTANGSIVVIALPSAVLRQQENDHYVISLESMVPSKPQRAGDFSFYVKNR